MCVTVSVSFLTGGPNLCPYGKGMVILQIASTSLPLKLFQTDKHLTPAHSKISMKPREHQYHARIGDLKDGKQ